MEDEEEVVGSLECNANAMCNAAMPCNAIQCNAMQYNAIQCNNSIQKQLEGEQEINRRLMDNILKTFEGKQFVANKKPPIEEIPFTWLSFPMHN